MSIQIVPASRELVCAALLVYSCVLFSSCRRQAAGPEDNGAQRLVAAMTPPFSTKEPERYQAVRTITTSETGSAQTQVTKTVISRDGLLRREEHEMSSGEKIVYLDNSSGRFVVLLSARLFATVEPHDSNELSSGDELSADLLLHETQVETLYERLGQEKVVDRSAMKYRVVSRSINGSARDAETIIWIDDALGMPLKWETIETVGEKEMRTTMQLSDITQTLDSRLFEVPAGFRKTDMRSLKESAGSPQQLHGDAVRK